MKLEGGCYCGAVRYVAEGEPLMQAQCHCRECQYITGNNAGTYDLVTQMISQGKAVAATLIWSGVGSAILYKVVDVIVGLRPSVEAEREGLDITDHGERAYNY